MPNATCFLTAYVMVLLLELIRWKSAAYPWDKWLKRALYVTALAAIFTHTLYLLDRFFVGFSQNRNLALVSWHDWSVFASWAIAVVYGFLLLRRGDSRIGIFILPTVILLVAGSIALPPSATTESQNSVTGWRFAHSVGMSVGTVLVSIGFAMGLMYFLHASRLKGKRKLQALVPLPSLEYLQSSGRACLLGSATSIGFGMVAGVIMNLTRDGRVEWLDRGILFSAGLFIWLVFASIAQWLLTRRGSGHATAWFNILSFAIVAIAVLLVLSTPHGGNRPSDPEPGGESADAAFWRLNSGVPSPGEAP